MAERRMFARTIIDSDAFLDMPITARLLYYDLAMRADDDGFVNAPKRIMRTVGASDDDLQILAAKKFIIPFDNGVVVIKHWRIHNYIRKDTYNRTPYIEQLNALELDENKAYTIRKDLKELPEESEPSTSRPRAVNEPSTQVILGNTSLYKDNPPYNPPTGEIEDEKPKKKKPATKDKMFDMVDEKPYSDLLKAGLKDWIEYKVEKGQSYQEKGFNALLKRVDNELANATDEAIVECISTSMENSYQGIVWDKLKRGGVTDRRNSIKTSTEAESSEGIYDDFAKNYFARRGIPVPKVR